MPIVDIEARRKYQREWNQRRRDEWLKANGPCKVCGATTDLQVDHIDPKTKVSHRIWTYSAERRAVELAKCQVLCRGCHIQKTSIENSKPLVHGTESGYSYYGCRCAVCKRAHADYRQVQRATAGRH